MVRVDQQLFAPPIAVVVRVELLAGLGSGLVVGQYPEKVLKLGIFIVVQLAP
jgi:hypothetical protein